jgi:hypothetical protein
MDLCTKPDVTGFVSQHDGYLNHYSDVVEGQMMTGAEKVQLVALDYLKPRLCCGLNIRAVITC